MTDELDARPPAVLQSAYDAVYGALQCKPDESLTQAAKRLLRAGRATLAELEVARRVASMTGCSPREQWTALLECAALLQRHDERKRRRHRIIHGKENNE